MNNKIILIYALMVFLLACAPISQADSIWAKRDKNMKNVYTDDVARNIGDVLTIKISEASKIDNKAKRDLKKETARSSEFDGQLGITMGDYDILPKMPGFTMQADTSNELKSKADFKDERKFVDSITVVVMDVMPNGNLVVMGTRRRDIAGDIQIVEVSGVVRPSDIAFDNTVQSEQVADFCIVSRNAGVSEPYNRPGWLGSIFDIVWPF